MNVTVRPLPWVMVGRSGDETAFYCQEDYLAAWAFAVQAIERGNRPIPTRREQLELLLKANADVFRDLVRHGAGDAVLDVTAAVVAADMRLAARKD